MSRISLVLLLVLCASVAAVGQSKKKSKKKTETSQQQSSSLSPYFPKEDAEPSKKASKKTKSQVTYNAQRDHEERMKAVVKANRKAEKEMLKPQYSDPSYFGHKRKPKKRPSGKMKFCKECEIRH